MTLAQFGTFFLPGPTECRPEILAALSGPMIAHRGKAFEELFARLEVGLRDVFLTARPVYIAASSATGMMEAAIRNAPPGRILSLVNGAFSDRFAKIAAACAREVDVHAVPYGETYNLDRVEAALVAGRYVAMTVVHSETSTGVLTDVHALTDLAHRHGVLCLVDSVTGIAGAELRFDEWQMDFALTGSQKALALPPGLAFAAASAEYLERARKVSDRGVYFDLVEYEEFAAKNQTPSTPALSLLYALDAQLANILREGIEARWARHSEMLATTTEFVEQLGGGVSILAPEGARSPTVTTIMLPEEIQGPDVVKAVAKRGYVIGGGYGKLKGTSIRIGHMGDHTVENLRRCLDEVGGAIEDLLDK